MPHPLIFADDVRELYSHEVCDGTIDRHVRIILPGFHHEEQEDFFGGTVSNYDLTLGISVDVF